jgi:hypothetical protein
MIRNLRESIGRIAGRDWTIHTRNGLGKPVAEVFCNVTGRRAR